jgi:hypothetical protein
MLREGLLFKSELPWEPENKKQSRVGEPRAACHSIWVGEDREHGRACHSVWVREDRETVLETGSVGHISAEYFKHQGGQAVFSGSVLYCKVWALYLWATSETKSCKPREGGLLALQSCLTATYGCLPGRTETSGPRSGDDRISTVSSLLQSVLLLSGVWKHQVWQAEGRVPPFSPLQWRTQLSASPTLPHTRGTPLSLDIYHSWAHKLGGLWSEYQSAQITDHKVTCSHQCLPVCKEDKLLKRMSPWWT